jgi:hypothetical protein
MSNKDGISKNISVVKQELRNWSEEMKANTARFRYGGLVNKGSRAPTGETNNNYFHLLTNYVSETYHNLPRTLTYITMVVIVVSLLELVL